MIDAVVRFFGGPFHDMVEQATSELLLGPDMERNLTLCDQANLKVDNAKEIIKALRRRTAHVNPKVNYLSLVLLGMLIKNGAPHVHVEVAECKDLLTDLLKLSTRPCTRDGAQEVKTEAIRFLLSCEVWFRGAQGGGRQGLGALSRLADQVREVGEITDTMAIDVLPLQGPQQQPQRQQLQRLAEVGQGGGQRRTQQRPPAEYAAPPVRAVAQGEVDQMFETLGVLAEMLNVAADPAQGGGTVEAITGNDLLMDLAHQVKQHYTQVAHYISSGAVPPDQLDVLFMLNESQTQIMERMGRQAQGGQAAPAAQQQGAPRPQPPPIQQQRAVVPPQPMPQTTLDDLFASPTVPPPQTSKAFPQVPMVAVGPGVPMPMPDPTMQRYPPTFYQQGLQPKAATPPPVSPPVAPAARPPRTDDEDLFNQFASSRATAPPVAKKSTSGDDDDFSQFAMSRDAAVPTSIIVPNVANAPAGRPPPPAPVVVARPPPPTPTPAPVPTIASADDFDDFASGRGAQVATVVAAPVQPSPSAPLAKAPAVAAPLAARADTDDFDSFLDGRLAGNIN